MSFWEFTAACEGFDSFHGATPAESPDTGAGAPTPEAFLAALGRSGPYNA